MSFLKTITAELTAAAAQLEGIGTSLAAQNASVATSTTVVSPAASDSVSQLQAGIFSAYGTLYQQFAAEAQTIQQQFVQTLGLSAGTYTDTEASNALAADSPVTSLTNFFNNVSTLIGPTANGSPFSLSGQNANFISYEAGNWASAMSDCLGMAGGGLIPSDWLSPAADAAGAADAVNATTPLPVGGVGTGAMGGMPMAAVGQATMVGNMSAPPSWAAGVTPVSSTTSVASALPGTSLASAASSGAPGGIYPGMPGMAGAGRSGAGFGAPRYGVKPIVMKKLGLAAV
jgi:PE family/PPE-SVP subfamily C-terminal region